MTESASQPTTFSYEAHVDRKRRYDHEEESNELLTMLYNLIQAAEHISPDETGITDMSFQGEGDTEILLRFKGKAFAIIAERF